MRAAAASRLDAVTTGGIDYLRACIVLVAVAWGPLLVMALSARVMIGHAFAIDWGVHARLLVAIPLLLLADASLHERTRFVVEPAGGRPLGHEPARTIRRRSSRAR